MQLKYFYKFKLTCNSSKVERGERKTKREEEGKEKEGEENTVLSDSSINFPVSNNTLGYTEGYSNDSLPRKHHIGNTIWWNRKGGKEDGLYVGYEKVFQLIQKVKKKVLGLNFFIYKELSTFFLLDKMKPYP